MKQIIEITNSPKQKMDIALEDGNQSFTLLLEFSQTFIGYSCWYFAIKYKDFLLGNDFVDTSITSPTIRLTTGINILRQFKNIIPFGISITTDDLSEPMLLNDFVSGRVLVHILNQSEVNDVENEFFK
jgi:hypothetical protein